MSNLTAPAGSAPDLEWRPRAKASLLGGVAATLAAPLMFLAMVLAASPGERGFWQNPSDVLVAIPAVWLFTGLVALPTSVIFGPIMLAAIAPLNSARIAAAIALGATLGAAVMNALPFLVGAAKAGFSVQLSAFAAAVGAVGAGVAVAAWGWLRRAAGAADAA